MFIKNPKSLFDEIKLREDGRSYRSETICSMQRFSKQTYCGLALKLRIEEVFLLIAQRRIKEVMKRYLLCSISMLLLLIFSACSGGAKQETLLTNIDKIQIITSMGHPAYGADSKIITDSNEIQAFIDTFNSAKIGDKVQDEDVGIGVASIYRLFSKGEIVAEYSFNGNDSNVIWKVDGYYHIEYDEGLKKPFELYKTSTAPIVVVDEKGNEIQRPTK